MSETLAKTTSSTTVENHPELFQEAATMMFSTRQLQVAIFGDNLEEMVGASKVAFHIYVTPDGEYVPVTFTGDEDGLSPGYALEPYEDSVPVGKNGIYVCSVLSDDVCDNVTDYESARKYVQTLDI